VRRQVVAFIGALGALGSGQTIYPPPGSVCVRRSLFVIHDGGQPKVLVVVTMDKCTNARSCGWDRVAKGLGGRTAARAHLPPACRTHRSPARPAAAGVDGWWPPLALLGGTGGIWPQCASALPARGWGRLVGKKSSVHPIGCSPPHLQEGVQQRLAEHGQAQGG